MANAALRLLRDDALATKVGDAARGECLARYTWPVVRAEWEDLYLSLARADAPQPVLGAR
jgi:glycosyltransferase involved in cell wall biosynthesis